MSSLEQPNQQITGGGLRGKIQERLRTTRYPPFKLRLPPRLSVELRTFFLPPLVLYSGSLKKRDNFIPNELDCVVRILVSYRKISSKIWHFAQARRWYQVQSEDS